MAVGITAMLALTATLAVAPAASARATRDLHGVITIEFPDYQKTTGKGCKADTIGSVAKLKAGNRVRVYRGVVKNTETKALDVKGAPIAKGKVGKGKLNDATDTCDVAFRAKDAPVLPDDQFYVVEVQGISTTQTVSAPRVTNGDLGSIPAEL
jgi:hypothetical protein